LKKGFENPLLKKRLKLATVKSKRHRTVIDVFHSLRSFQVGFFDFFLFPLEGKKSKNPTQLLPYLVGTKFQFQNSFMFQYAKF
jgi:hypothetical protein